MGTETITDQYTWFSVRSILSLGVKNKLKPFEAYLRVVISVLGECIILSRGWASSPVAPVALRRPDYEW